MARSRRSMLTAAVLTCAAAACAAPQHREQVLSRTAPTEFLECEPPAVALETQKNVNWRGQDVEVGRNKLHMKIRGQSDTRITFRQIPGTRVNVEIEADPAQQFRRSPRLEISLDRCTEEQIRSRPWSIWRFTPSTGEWERLATTLEPAAKRAITHIDHNSNYMMAN